MTFLSSCFSEDKPRLDLPPHVEEISTKRESNGQIYYSLRDRKALNSNSIYVWDLAFSCAKGDFTIAVNSAKKMAVHNTGSKEFDVSYPSAHSYYDWTYDHPSGALYKSGIGGWGDFNFDNPQSFGDVYIINMGYDKFNLPYSLKKMRIDGFKNDSYEISFSDVDGDTFERLLIPKNDNFNFVYASLAGNGNVFQLEPPKNDWDIMITNYIDSTKFRNVYTKSDSINSKLTIYDGVLVNPYDHSVALDSINDFSSIDFFSVGNNVYRKGLNTIGYKWYDWDNVGRKYMLSNTRTFVVKHGHLNYYMIEFEEVYKPRKDELFLKFAIKNL